MAELNMKISCRVYGMRLAKAVYAVFDYLGFDPDDCLSAAKACVFVRVSVGKHKSWVWGW